jgi:hypothetical protein
MMMRGVFREACRSLAQGFARQANVLGEAERQMKPTTATEAQDPEKQRLLDEIKLRRLILSDISESFSASRDFFEAEPEPQR